MNDEMIFYEMVYYLSKGGKRCLHSASLVRFPEPREGQSPRQEITLFLFSLDSSIALSFVRNFRIWNGFLD